MTSIVGDLIESLNYIDPSPSPEKLLHIKALIEAEIPVVKADYEASRITTAVATTTAVETTDSHEDTDETMMEDDVLPVSSPQDDTMTDVTNSPPVSELTETTASTLPSASSLPSTSKPETTSSTTSPSIPSEHTLHPRMRPFTPPTFSPAITAAHDVIAKAGKEETSSPDWTLTGIDPSRYSSIPESPSSVAVGQLYSTATYLETRRAHLSLLGATSSVGKTASGTGGVTFGQGTWLIGNELLSKEIENVEREIAGIVKREEEVGKIEAERQSRMYGEMEVLEGQWRDGVYRLDVVMDALDQLNKQ